MLRKLIKKVLNKFGYILADKRNITNDVSTDVHKIDIFQQVSPYSMTSYQRIAAIIDAIDYLNKYNIGGDIVECGVWKGGSIMAAALSLKFHNQTDREFYLYDTYEGMSAPTEFDINRENVSATEYLNNNEKTTQNLIWAYSSLGDVQKNVYSTGYPQDKIKFIKGKVEETLLETLPNKIALLRLDTDWYESTKCELENLFPLLVNGGVLIIDDYEDWQGCKKAVDEYFQLNNIRIFLGVIDRTGRIAIKQQA